MFIVQLRQFKPGGKKRPLPRFCFVERHDAGVRVEAVGWEEAHEKALSTRDDPSGWYTVVCALETKLAENEFGQALRASATG